MIKSAIMQPTFIPWVGYFDLIDESASKLKMEITSKPQELDEIDRKILQLQILKYRFFRFYNQRRSFPICARKSTKSGKRRRRQRL